MQPAYALALGFLLGFSLTIPPGPMNALIASQTLRSFRSGVITGFGAMSADLVLGVLVYALRTVVDLGAYLRVVYGLGAVVMIALVVRLWRRHRVEASATAGELRTYGQALAVGVSNPFQVVWWLTAGLAFAYLGGLVLFGGLFAAILVWVLAFPYALRKGVERRPSSAEAILYVSVALLIAFAVYFAVLAV